MENAKFLIDALVELTRQVAVIGDSIELFRYPYLRLVENETQQQISDERRIGADMLYFTLVERVDRLPALIKLPLGHELPRWETDPNNMARRRLLISPNQEAALRFVVNYFVTKNALLFEEGSCRAGAERLVEQGRGAKPVLSRTYLQNLVLMCGDVDLGDGVYLSPVTTKEREALLNSAGHIPTPSPFLSGNDSLLRIRARLDISPESEQVETVTTSQRASNVPYEVVNILRLYADHPVNIVFTTTGPGVRQAPMLPGSDILGRGDFTLDAIKAKELSQLWTTFHASPNHDKVDLAIRRLGGSYSRSDPVDRMLDHWIAIESLLFTKDENAELSFRVALRMAILIAVSGEDRRQVFENCKMSYALRSKIIHGSHTKLRKVEQGKKTLSDVEVETRAYLRRAIIRILSMDHEFDVKDLERNLLDGSFGSAI